MCGIAGCYRSQAPGTVKRMLKTLAHRGPDGSGVNCVPEGTLGHTRLAILDVKGGHQPMSHAKSWVAFNGEIYNYRELRDRYLAGHEFHTHSDTEVLLHLYQKFGPECVELLDGMFAFALFQNGEMLLARDPIGIKPLYYDPGKDGEILHFASEIKALTPVTRNVKEFPAGHWYHSRLGWHRYYQVGDTVRPFDGDPQEALPRIRSTLREAVRKRLLADVPVGISLSGGLDSSIVSALACEGTDQLHSFAVGVQESADLAAARKMSEFLHTQHHELVYTTQDMLDGLPDVLYHLETFDPALVRSAIPNYFLARLASRYVKVILTGEGADELYAGYQYLDTFDDAPAKLQEEMLFITEALHNTNLQRADRMSMAFSLEARVPFLDVDAIALALSFPPAWKTHSQRVPKALLRRAFTKTLPAEIVNRPKQKFSKGAGSSDLLAQHAAREISDGEFTAEKRRLRRSWNYDLKNKEALYYYRILRRFYDDKWIFPTMGHSRSL